jgi:hypothetical protein
MGTRRKEETMPHTLAAFLHASTQGTCGGQRMPKTWMTKNYTERLITESETERPELPQMMCATLDLPRQN